MNYKKTTIAFLLLGISFNNLYCGAGKIGNIQSFSKATVADKDSTDDDSDDSNSLVLGIIHSGNTGMAGKFNNDVKQPSNTPSVSFISKHGLILSVTSTFIGNSDSTETKTTTETALEAGYQKKLSKSFMFSGSLTHFIYSQNYNSTMLSYNNKLDLGLGFDVKHFNSTLTANFLSGGAKEFLISSNNSVPIKFDKVIFKNASLLIQPEFDADFSNNRDYYLFWLNNKSYLSKAIKRLGKKNPKLTKAELSALLDKKTLDKSKFEASAITLIIPITYTIKNISFATNYVASRPINQPVFIDSKWFSYFTFEVTYSFDW